MRHIETIKTNSVAGKTFNRDAIIEITMSAVGIALVYVFTAFVNITLPFAPNGGLVHLGNVPLFILAILFGKRTGAIAGGIGMGLFDLLSPWAIWAPFTFVIVGTMGFIVGEVSEKKKGFGWSVFAMLLALIIKIAGYYFAEVIIYGNWIVPFTSIPGNIIQVVVAAVVVMIVIEPLKKAAKMLMQ
jgi:uncharacterized membrane protein